jgi:predicted transcriptional regulator
MEILSKLFGSSARVKVMKLFLSNEEIPFDNAEISKRTKVALSVLRRELNLLEKTGLIKKKVFYKEVEQKQRKKKGQKKADVKIIKKKTSGWILNDKFPYLVPMQNLLVNMTSFTSSSVLKKFSGAGKLKLVLLSGVFIQNSDSRIDILVVGDSMKVSYIEKAVAVLESEIGKELRYVVLGTDDFKYRLNIYDKLVRDILDYPHQKIINRLGV